jgi:TusA-related sulfurtransferase
MSDAAATVTADKIVDTRCTACPGPLLEAKKGIGSVKAGQVVEIKSKDKSSRKDIAAWAGQVGHEFLGCIEAEDHDRLLVRRKK